MFITCWTRSDSNSGMLFTTKKFRLRAINGQFCVQYETYYTQHSTVNWVVLKRRWKVHLVTPTKYRLLQKSDSGLANRSKFLRVMPTLFKMSDDKKTEDIPSVVFTQVSNMKRIDFVAIKINLCLTCLMLSYLVWFVRVSLITYQNYYLFQISEYKRITSFPQIQLYYWRERGHAARNHLPRLRKWSC